LTFVYYYRFSHFIKKKYNLGGKIELKMKKVVSEKMDIEEKLANNNGILQYENEIILQLYHEDGLLVLAR
jgi:hypothetical protein